MARRNVSEIPRWFKLQNYATVDQFGLKEWFEHLAVRSHFETIFALYGEPGDPFRWKEDDAPSLKRKLAKLRASPLALDPDLLSFTNYELSQGGRETRRRYDGVQSLSVAELFEQEKGIAPAEAIRVRAYVNQTSLDVLGKGTLKEEWMMLPIAAWSENQSAIGLIKVDLSLPDGTLREQFADWLSEIRLLPVNSARRPPHKRPDRAEWVKMRLLPCIDLLLWSRENGRSLPPVAVSKAIYGDPSREEAVRKTTLPLAGSLLDRDDRGSSIMKMLKLELASNLAAADRFRSK